MSRRKCDFATNKIVGQFESRGQIENFYFLPNRGTEYLAAPLDNQRKMKIKSVSNLPILQRRIPFGAVPVR